MRRSALLSTALAAVLAATLVRSAEGLIRSSASCNNRAAFLPGTSIQTVTAVRGGAGKKGKQEEDDEARDDDDNDQDEDYSEVSEEEEEDEYDDDEEQQQEEEEDEEEEYDEEYDIEGDDEYEEEESMMDSKADGDTVLVASAKTKTQEYVEPYFQSPMLQLYTTLGIFVISSKIDLFNPLIVKIIRALYIAQLVLQQAFVIYVSFAAKRNNDRTPVQMNNPLADALKSQLTNRDGTNDMVKNLASTFLSSQSTVVEYDRRQAKNMQGGVIFNMLFMWILHFRMGQVQPLLYQICSGITNLIYSPLFQVYILGRNLERPFKTRPMPEIPSANETTTTAGTEVTKASASDEEKQAAELVEEHAETTVSVASTDDDDDEEEEEDEEEEQYEEDEDDDDE